MTFKLSLISNLKEYENIIDIIQCVYCKNILDTPKMCNKCFNLCCSTNCLNNSNNCNLCNSEDTLVNAQLPKNFKDLLNKIRFKCPYNDKGCEQILNQSTLKSHIEQCKICSFCQNNKQENHDDLKCSYIKIDLVVNQFAKLLSDVSQHEPSIKEFNKSNDKLKFVFDNLDQNYVSNHQKLNESDLSSSKNSDDSIYKFDEELSQLNNQEMEGTNPSVTLSQNTRQVTQSYPDGSKQVGEMIGNKKIGYGTFIYQNGDKQEGYYQNNLKDGKGKMTQSNGSIQEGEFKNNKRHGNARLKYRNGDFQDGEFFDDFRHGFGRYYQKNGDFQEGMYTKGERSGYGKFTSIDGSQYEGDFFKGQRHGKGKFKYISGSLYEGDFDNGKAHGYGVLKQKNGELQQGRFENGTKVE